MASDNPTAGRDDDAPLGEKAEAAGGTDSAKANAPNRTNRPGPLLQMTGAVLAVFIAFLAIGGAAVALGASNDVLDFLGQAYMVVGVGAMLFVVWRTRNR